MTGKKAVVFRNLGLYVGRNILLQYLQHTHDGNGTFF
jgi:hypothetical protein